MVLEARLHCIRFGCLPKLFVARTLTLTFKLGCCGHFRVEVNSTFERGRKSLERFGLPSDQSECIRSRP